MATPLSVSPLLSVPVEIFDMIIDFLLPEQWAGQMPVIIKALRPIPQLYQRALGFFDKKQYSYILHQGNEWGFGDMADSVISGVRNLTIAVNTELLHDAIQALDETDTERKDGPMHQLLQSSSSSRSADISTLHFMADTRCPEDEQIRSKNDSEIPFHFVAIWPTMASHFSADLITVTFPSDLLEADGDEHGKMLTYRKWRRVTRQMMTIGRDTGIFPRLGRVQTGEEPGFEGHSLPALEREWVWIMA